MYQGIKIPKKVMLCGGLLLVLFLCVLSLAYGEEKAAVTLLSVSPAEGSYISRTPVFTLNFDKNVANASVRDMNQDLVTFMDSGGNEVLTHVEIADDEIYPTLKRIIEVHVLETLPPGRYKLLVAAGIQAKNGTRTSESYSFYYRVKEEEVIETESESETETESAFMSESVDESDMASESELETEGASESVNESESELEIEAETETTKADLVEGESTSAKESKSEGEPVHSPDSRNDKKEDQDIQEDKDRKETPKEDLFKKKQPEESVADHDKKNQKPEASLALYEIVLSPEEEMGETLLAPLEQEDVSKEAGDGAPSGLRDPAWPFLGLLVMIGFIYRIVKFKKERD